MRGLVSCLPSLRDARLIGTRLKSADAGASARVRAGWQGGRASGAEWQRGSGISFRVPSHAYGLAGEERRDLGEKLRFGGRCEVKQYGLDYYEGRGIGVQSAFSLQPLEDRARALIEVDREGLLTRTVGGWAYSTQSWSFVTRSTSTVHGRSQVGRVAERRVCPTRV